MRNSALKAAVIKYVEENIGSFHNKRIEGIRNLKLKNILKRKNPYLFKAKHILTSEELIKSLVDAHLSSNEEAIFGDWLEGLAIFVNGYIYGGQKSGIEGIDLEFFKDESRYIVSIKSGPNWGNSGQIRRMKDDFTKAAKTIRTSNSNLNVIAVNGCCYGKDKNFDKGTYLKLCGQRFWEFISGDPELYIEIIEPLGTRSRERNDEFLAAYSRMINNFTHTFSSEFCTDGTIDWGKLVYYNSSK